MIPPKIGITLGDPGGIGPEIILKALVSENSLPRANYIIFGSRFVVEQEINALGFDLDIPSLNKTKKAILPPYSLYEIGPFSKTLKKGAPSTENGKASFLFFEEAVNKARKGTIQAIVTAPISKHSWKMAGITWAGHTDYLSQIYPQTIMSFWSEELKVALFTHHIPLNEALKKIKKKALLDFFLLLHKNINKVYTKKYQFLVSGLNPHAGEEGLMGSEEEEEIIPAIESAKKEGVPISGPFPPDTIFREASNKPDNIVIALYHDQGLIPFKLKAFDNGINVTLGLPFIRTSPDHGTAFDIAGKGVANHKSMVEAIRFAHKLVPFF